LHIRQAIFQEMIFQLVATCSTCETTCCTAALVTERLCRFGDHPHTNFRSWYARLKSLGYFVEGD
jgi:hypothetical protein